MAGQLLLWVLNRLFNVNGLDTGAAQWKAEGVNTDSMPIALPNNITPKSTCRGSGLVQHVLTGTGTLRRSFASGGRVVKVIARVVRTPRTLLCAPAGVSKSTGPLVAGGIESARFARLDHRHTRGCSAGELVEYRVKSKTPWRFSPISASLVPTNCPLRSSLKPRRSWR